MATPKPPSASLPISTNRLTPPDPAPLVTATDKRGRANLTKWLRKGKTMNAAKITGIDKWEAAWQAYVSALEAYDDSRHEVSRRSSSGHSRLHKGNGCRLRDAIAKLRKLDADFCDRQGIKAWK